MRDSQSREPGFESHVATVSKFGVAEELHENSHAARHVCDQQQTAVLERQPDRRASLPQNMTRGSRVFACWIWRGLALLASPKPTGHRDGPCENSDVEMGLSRRRPLGELRLRGATDDDQSPLLPPTRRGLYS